MLAKARTFAKHSEDLFSYIEEILKDSAFQADPKAYLDRWEEERGFAEMFIFPDDKARIFFDQNFGS